MKLDTTTKNPLSAEGEERVAHEVPRGESTARIYYRSAITHPVFASLDHPSLRCAERGEKNFYYVCIIPNKNNDC